MKSFLIKISLSVVIFLTVLFILLKVSSTIVKNRGFSNSNTESNTLFLKSNVSYDILFMGISHARNFSRFNNHHRIEKILDANVINLGQGRGRCGAKEQQFYLDYFQSKGNEASLIIYVLSPPLLFAETLPVATNTFDDEVFSLPFLVKYLPYDSPNKQGRIMSYISSKLNSQWIFKQPDTTTANSNSLQSLDTAAVTEGQNIAYSGTSKNLQQFEKTSAIIESTIASANKESEILLLIPPALFGQWRGHQQVLEFAKEMRHNYTNVQIADCSNSVLKPELYYDNHHLNTNGVIYFAEHHLKPILNQYYEHTLDSKNIH